MKQSQRSIGRAIKALRKCIDSSSDPIVTRIAYTVENALRWSTEDTKGWRRPEADVLVEAEILRKELVQEVTR